MKITSFEATRFSYTSFVGRDEEGHGHPAAPHDAVQTLMAVHTDEGVSGHCFGGSPELARLATTLLAGRNPLDREAIWQHVRQLQRMDRVLLSDRGLGVIDEVLWDFAGQLTGLPVYRLLGGFRDKVPAYASTMCGDDLPGGLNTPEAYGEFALACKRRGYPAFKLHTWMRPLGPDPKHDVAACRAVREAVGPDMHLMLDCHHDYTREEARYIGRELEKLDYHWFEEPMSEASISSYVWLSEQLDIPMVGPESALGQIQTRAEWIVLKASDISRYDVHHGGITPMMKAVHLCEAFGMRIEIHGPGAAHLHTMGAMGIPGEYYERGLLHPFVDYEAQTPWLNQIIDPIDDQGFVPVPQGPGLGHDINWDYIREHTLKP